MACLSGPNAVRVARYARRLVELSLARQRLGRGGGSKLELWHLAFRQGLHRPIPSALKMSGVESTWDT